MRHQLSLSQFQIDRDLPVRVLRRDPQHEYPLHTHEFAELVIIYGGKGEHVVSGERMAIEAGDIFVIHPQTMHGYLNLYNLKLFNIIFDLDSLSYPFSEYSGSPAFQALFMLRPDSGTHGIRLSGNHLGPLLDLVEQMLKEEENHLQFCNMMLTGLFIQLVSMLGRLYFDYAKNPLPPPMLQIGKVINAVLENCAADWTRAEMAELASMSESSLTRAFKKYTGYSPGNYLIHLRIKKAEALLQRQNQRINEIGASVGFRDSNYFSRQFHRINGLTPRQYRESCLPK